jgi:hypothetical protein
MKLTRRRKLILSLAALAACAVGCLAVARMLGPSTADAARITVGMPKADVEAILGPAPNDFTWDLAWTNSFRDRWQVTDGYIYVGFGDDQHVIEVWSEHVPVWQRLYENVCGWWAGPVSSY